MRVVVLGADGMLGSMVHRALDYEFDVVGGIRDLGAPYLPRDLKYDEFAPLGEDEMHCLLDGADWVINCAGKIKLKPHETMEAIEINALFPHTLLQYGVPVIQPATDCVFGEAPGFAAETDTPKTSDVYSQTKNLGEVKDLNFYNLRCSIVGPEIKSKKNLLEWFLSHKDGDTVPGFKNRYWNGITTYHFAKICQGIIEEDYRPPNTQHIIPSGNINIADLFRIFGRHFGRKIMIEDTIGPSINRILSTNNHDIVIQLWKNAGYNTPPTIDEMIQELSEVKLV
jgi:dTDP-4-dehydrorhamnose reductase